MFQYGRMNIESANKKRGIISHVEEVDAEADKDVDYKPDTPPTPKKNGLVKKLSQNGLESLISKQSLILVPERGEVITQNGIATEKAEELSRLFNTITNNNILNVDEEVINQREIALD